MNTTTDYTIEDDLAAPVAHAPTPAVFPQVGGAAPSRRRQRERPADAEGRIPALTALDEAAEYVLIVRGPGGVRVFAEGGLAITDADGDTVDAASALSADLPFTVAEGAVAPTPASALDTSVPAVPFEDILAGEPDGLAALGLEPGTGAGSEPDFGETSQALGFGRGDLLVESPLVPATVEEDEGYLAVALVLPGGRHLTVDGTVLIGRSPSESARTDSPELVALAANLTDISRTHLEVTTDGDAVYVRDNRSTNGTVLTRRGQTPVLIPSDEPMRVYPGDSLNLAGSATIEIEGVR
ncbi:MAG: hypothetical protein JWP66_1091 [Naasia sp.]|nr:hypothetical protein [Naasia sp.]